MCRICGRVVKCIFDTMPSKIPMTSTRSFYAAAKRSSVNHNSQHVSSRTLIQSAFRTNEQGSRQIPSFLLPHRVKMHQIASQQTEASFSPQFEHTQPQIPPTSLENTQAKEPASQDTEISSLSQQPSHKKPLVLSKSLQELLPSLCSQRPHYISAHIHRFPYLLTEGDTVRLPFHMHGVSPGDILRFNRASILGSRDLTLKAGMHSTETYDKTRTGEPNYIDERLFECRARVLGVDSGPMMLKEKTKRRNRKVKTVRSKHKYTVLKIMEIKVKNLEQLQQDKEVLLLE